METILKLIAITALVLTFASQSPNGKIDKDPNNKSPCDMDEVVACQAQGGTWDWKHCFCETP